MIKDRNLLPKIRLIIHSHNNSIDKLISLSFFKTLQRLNMKHLFNQNFLQWFVGFVDGDGCFSVHKDKNRYTLSFKISQSSVNRQVIYKIKKHFKIGNVNIDKKNNMVSYVIRDKKKLCQIIYPIFYNYPLLTSKFFYFKWQRYYLFFNNDKKNDLINETLYKIYKKGPCSSYISPFSIEKPSKYWIHGFIEAEGSFFITSCGLNKKGYRRFSHSFGISQKLDNHLLESIKAFFKIKSRVRKKNQGYFLLETKSSRCLNYIIDTLDKKNVFYGHKTWEFKVWKRSWVKSKHFKDVNKKYNYLSKIQKILRNSRKNL